MLSLLLVVCLTQPLPEADAALLRELGQQFQQAIARQNTDPDDALRRYTAILDDPRLGASRHPIVQMYRMQARYLRAQLLTQRGGAQDVVEEMTALLRVERGLLLARSAGLVGTLATGQPLAALGTLPPDQPLSRGHWYQLLACRAGAYDALGERARAEADRASGIEALREAQAGVVVRPPEDDEDDGPFDPIPPSFWYEWFDDPPAFLRYLTGPLLVVLVVVLMAPLFFVMGLRQRRDARGSWWRLAWVAFVLALLQALPVLATVLLATWQPRLVATTALVFIACLVFVVNIFRQRAYLQPAVWDSTQEAPPLLDDPVVQRRIDELAARMGVAPPVARVVHSGSALQQNQAMISGVVAPTLLIYDGILYRLAEDERDAILAHELGHLANHTLWWWLLAGAFVGVAVVVAAAFYPVLVVLALGTTLLTGTWLILSRRLELDSDRRAARAIGHRRTASALWKVDADQPFHGVIEFLLTAVATHPARDARLAAVYHDAPAHDRPDIVWNVRLLTYRHLAAWTLGLVWFVCIVGALVWGWYHPASLWPALPLIVPEVAFVGVCWLAFRKQLRRTGRLLRSRRDRAVWPRLVPPVLLGALLLSYWLGWLAFLGHLLTLGVLLVAALLVLIVLSIPGTSGRTALLHNRVAVAIQSNDYPRALDLCEENWDVVVNHTPLRYNRALVLAVLGRRVEALEELERIREDDPAFKMTWLLLASIYADECEFARALEVAEELRRDLPDEPGAVQMLAWLLRKVGRLDEAERFAREALAAEPQAGHSVLTLAAIALDRGDHAAARDLLAQGERLTPGTVGGQLVAAELALATNDPAAHAAIERAIAGAKNNPLAFADKEATGLLARLSPEPSSELPPT